MSGACSMYGRYEKRIQNFGRKTWKDHAEDLGIDGKTLLEWILEARGVKVWTKCNWLMIGNNGVLLWTFGFYKWRGISSLAKGLLASQGPYCTDVAATALTAEDIDSDGHAELLSGPATLAPKALPRLWYTSLNRYPFIPTEVFRSFPQL
jgi:hypothetical protein